MTRLDAFCKAFGWQGGTIAQVADATGCQVDQLLQGHHCEVASDFDAGWFDGCEVIDRRRKRLQPGTQAGNLDYWLGVCLSIMENARAV